MAPEEPTIPEPVAQPSDSPTPDAAGIQEPVAPALDSAAAGDPAAPAPAPIAGIQEPGTQEPVPQSSGPQASVASASAPQQPPHASAPFQASQPPHGLESVPRPRRRVTGPVLFGIGFVVAQALVYVALVALLSGIAGALRPLAEAAASRSPTAPGVSDAPTPSVSGSPEAGDLYAAELPAHGVSQTDPAPWGTAITLAAVATSRPALSFAAAAPADITAAAAAAGAAASTHGSYLAVPITVGLIDAPALQGADGTLILPSTGWTLATADPAEPVDLEVPGYPTLRTAEQKGDTITYYEIFDVSHDDVRDGQFVLFLQPVNSSPPYLVWGGAIQAG